MAQVVESLLSKYKAERERERERERVLEARGKIRPRAVLISDGLPGILI
jgi:hypothetical protein